MEVKEREINAHRRRVVGEEKRIFEEMKRQKEIDMMYEIMNKNGPQRGTQQQNETQTITFDYEGKIISIHKPNEEQFPETITNPKIKFKAAQVHSNFMKEQLEKLNQSKQLNQSKSFVNKSQSKGSGSVADNNSVQDQTISSISISKFEQAARLKKNSKLVEIFKPMTKDQEKGKDTLQRPNPMGSNFNDMQPKPGIVIQENGKLKQNKSLSKLAANKLSIDEY